MDYERWEPFYKQIIEDFGYDEEEDFQSGKDLSILLEKTDTKANLETLKGMMVGKDAYIFGAGPSLRKDILRLFKRNNLNIELPADENLRPAELKTPQGLGFKQVWIAADIATTTLMNCGVIPDVIITDLDGIVEDQLDANSRGAILVVHAHGNNKDKVKKYVPELKGCVIGTMQATPKAFDNLVNFGGFTDGDRAVFIADEFSAKNILLIAFNFKEPTRKKPNGTPMPAPEEEDPAMAEKLRKLTWANVLIAMLDNNSIRFFDDR